MSEHKHEFDFAGHCECGMNYTSALEADRDALVAVAEKLLKAHGARDPYELALADGEARALLAKIRGEK